MCSSSTHSACSSPISESDLYAKTRLVLGKPKWVAEGVLRTYNINYTTQTSSTFHHYIFALVPPLQLARGHFEDEGRVSRDALWQITCYKQCEVGASCVMNNKELYSHGIDPIDGTSSLPAYQDRIFDVRLVSSCDPITGTQDESEERWEVKTYSKLSYGTSQLTEDEFTAHKIDPQSGCSALAAYKDCVFLVRQLALDPSTVSVEEDYCAGKTPVYEVTCSKVLPKEPGAGRRLSGESLRVHRIDPTSGKSALSIYNDRRFDVREVEEGSYTVQVRRDPKQEKALQYIRNMVAHTLQLQAKQQQGRELHRATSWAEFHTPGSRTAHASSYAHTPAGSYRSPSGVCV